MIIIFEYPIPKGCEPIFCQKCLSTELIDPVDQSAVSCEYCGKDLSEALEGTIICKGCADLRQLCQRCGRPLRLADFKGIFVGTGGARLHRWAEKQIIALLLGRQK